MPIFVSERDERPGAQPQFAAPALDVLSASAGQTLTQLPIPSLLSAGQIGVQELFGNPIDYSSAKTTAERAGVKLDNELYHNTTSQALDYRIRMKSEEDKRNAVMSLAPDSSLLSAGTVLTSFAMQFADPVNVLSGFVPVVGEARSAAWIASMGRYGGRAAIGAVEGTVGNALTEALVYPAQQYIGADYTMNDSLTSIAMGAPFGAVLHTLPEAFRDARGAFTVKKAAAITPVDLADFKLDDIADLGEALDVPAIAAARSSDAAEQAWNDAAEELSSLGIEIKQGAPPVNAAEELRAVANTVAEPDVRASIEAQAKKIEENTPDAVDAQIDRARAFARGEIKAPVDRAPKFPFINEIIKRGGVRVGSVLDDELRYMGVTPQKFRKLFKKDGGLTDVDNIPASDWKASAAQEDGNGYVDRNHILYGISEEMSGKPLRPADYIPPSALPEEKMLEHLDRIGVDVNTMSNAEIKEAIAFARRVDDDGADAKIFQASGVTRQEAMKAGIAQALDGRPINVEPILRTDPHYGEKPPTAEELADMAKPYIDEEGTAIDEALEERLAIQEEDLVKSTDEAFDQGQELTEISFGKSTASDVLSSVKASFGKATERLLDTVQLRVVQSIDRLPKGIDYPDDVKGVKLPDGTVYLVADNIDASEVKGLVLHEAGVHLGMRAIMGDAKFSALLDDVMASTDPSVARARESVPKETPSHQIAEETLAYLVENAPEANSIRSIISAVKAWAHEKFGLRFEIDEFTARSMALGALRRVSKLGEGKNAAPFFSRIDKTKQGDQFVLGGAEKISDKQLAERKMSEALKAKKPQQEMDIGIFGDSAKQTTLFSRAQKPDKSQPALDLQLEKRVFDRALKDAEKYPTILRGAVKFANGQDDAGLRVTLEESGVTPSMVTAVMQELKKQHVRVQNELRRQRKLMKTEDAIDADKSFEDVVAERTAQEIKERIEAAKREAAYNFVARERAKLIIRDYGSFADEGFLATLTGSSMLREGARSHVAAYQSAYLKQWANGIEAALKKDGAYELFMGRTLERDVSRALEELDFKTPNMQGINVDAVRIAKIMQKYQEGTRMTLNKLGASIKYTSGYITRQSHDQLKIRSAGFEQWAKDARGWFNFEAMRIPASKVDKALRSVWEELASGTYQVGMPTEMKDGDFRSGLNLAKKVSQSRSIVFKKNAWFDYNAKYGTRDVAAAYMRGIENSARVAGLMKMWGSNPQYNVGRAIDDMIEELRNSGDVDGATNLKNKRQKIINNLAIVDGSANIPGNVMGAQIASNIRLGQMMAKLGGALWSSFTDVPLYAANMRYEGRGNMFKGMADAITGIAVGAKSGARAEVLKHLELTFDHFVGEVMHQYTRGAGFSQNMSAMARLYTKFNLQQGWTSRLQKAAAYGFSNYLGDASGKSFSALSDDMRRIFKIHSIDEAKWDVLRQSVRNIEGKNYLVTDAISEIGDDVIAKYLTAKGKTVSDESIRIARERIANDYRAMVIDRAESAALSGDRRVEAAMSGGTKRGTVWGEAVRFVGQFKSFPAMMVERVIKREIYGRGYDTMGDFLKRGKGDILGLANLLVAMALTGYVSLSIKDAIKGKTPRPLDRGRTWTEAMMQGGFFGIAGDYMLNEYDNYSGRSFAANLLGPTGGAINDLFALKTALENGDKTAIRSLKLLQNNLPGANLFYVKPIMDYMFMYSLMEHMNPGYLRRMEANSVKDTGQQWLIRPSSVAR